MEQKSNASLESDLMSHLKSANFSKEHMEGLSKSIASWRNSGVKLVDWWIYGIPAFENFVIQGHLAIDKVDVIREIMKDDLLTEIRILRKGIPKPDIFQINITTNKARQQTMPG